MQPTMVGFARQLVLVFIVLVASIAHAQGADSNALASAMLSQTGLHLPKGASDIFDFIRDYSSGPERDCDVFSVRWVSWPGDKWLRINEADQQHVPQSFSLEGHNSRICQPRQLRPDFRFSGLLVFGTTDEGEIRSLQVFPRNGDPRVVILDCFGGKSPPETRCGEWVRPQATLTLLVPHSAAISKLRFFMARSTAPTEWQLEPLGILSIR
jgi:hypothetical protein